MKIKDRGNDTLAFKCPGCKRNHNLNRSWQFNEDFENPTISPSIKVTMPQGKGKEDWICHSFIKNGQIQFLNDCTHDLAGQTVELLDWSE